MRKKLTLKERLEAISSTIHAAADRSAANAVQKACNEALAEIERLEAELIQADHLATAGDDLTDRLYVERDEAVEHLKALADAELGSHQKARAFLDKYKES